MGIYRDTMPEPLAELVRDHDRALEVVSEARSAAERAANGPESLRLFTEMLEALRGLEQFLMQDLTVHIAKEERALFPALRQLDRHTDRIVDDMVVQHDEIRDRGALIERVIATVDAHQDTIGPEREAFVAALQETVSAAPSTAVATLRDSVKRLDWILQGHFEDEEEHLFVPAVTLLPADTLADLAQQMAELERSRSADV